MAWSVTVAGVLVYTTAVLASLPPPLYFYPRLGTWSFHLIQGEAGVRWYGWMIYAAVGGLLGMLIGRFMTRRPPWVLVWLFATASLFLLAWHERQWFLN